MALFPLGILSAAGVSGAVASDYELITTNILGSAQSEVVFSSLDTYASTYKHLQIRAVARDTRSGFAGSNLQARINGDTGNNYAVHLLDGNGSSVGSVAAANHPLLLISDIPGATGTADSFGAAVFDILDAYSTTKNKTVRALGGVVGNYNVVSLRSSARFNVASITSITLFGLGNLVAGSRFSLYGIKG